MRPLPSRIQSHVARRPGDDPARTVWGAQCFITEHWAFHTVTGRLLLGIIQHLVTQYQTGQPTALRTIARRSSPPEISI